MGGAGRGRPQGGLVWLLNARKTPGAPLEELLIVDRKGPGSAVDLWSLLAPCAVRSLLPRPSPCDFDASLLVLTCEV